MAEKKFLIQFSVKLHQDFSHNRVATRENAKAFLNALQPLIEANCLANLFLQFSSQFERTLANRRYLADLQNWFENQPLAIEFRHSSWHIPPVFDTFAKSENLIWCNVDYPQHIGLPAFHFYANQRRVYLRLHGRNPNWWKGQSAAERHDYRYSEKELQALATLLAAHRNEFDVLYLYFENKPEPKTLLGQQSLF